MMCLLFLLGLDRLLVVVVVVGLQCDALVKVFHFR